MECPDVVLDSSIDIDVQSQSSLKTIQTVYMSLYTNNPMHALEDDQRTKTEDQLDENGYI